MTRRTTLLLSLALALPTMSHAGPRNFVAYMAVEEWNYIDLGQPGRSLGDVVTGRGTIAKSPGGTPTGHYEWGATVVQLLTGDQELRQSVVQFEWGDNAILAGKIFQAPAHSNPNQTVVYAITGGTGIYARARGTLIFEPTSANTFKATFKIR